MKKHKLSKLFLGEFSLVRKPAHEGATIDLTKADNSFIIALRKAAPEPDPTCAGCKAPMAKSAKHCSECGVAKAAPAPTIVPTPTPAPENPPMSMTDAEKAHLTKTEKLAELNDVQKAHYRRLPADEQPSFLAKSFAERAEECKPIHTSADGMVFTKADDPRMIEMSKSADKDRKDMAEKLEKADNTILKQRAEVELKHLPGSVEARASLIKAAESIKDPKEREEALAALKAHDTAMSQGFQRQGLGSTVVDPTSPQGQLDILAKAYATENKCDLAKAMNAVLSTEKGGELYAMLPTPKTN